MSHPMANDGQDAGPDLESQADCAAKRILLEALERPSERRDEFVKQACQGDQDLLTEVNDLLALHEDEEAAGEEASGLGTLLDIDFGRILATELQAVGPQPHDEPSDETVVGRYRLRAELGRGGSGVVYLAEQTEPVKRDVAIKILHAGGKFEKLLKRFELERRMQSQMDHPNIARVIDAGATGEGRPFLVMEYVAGERVTDYCDSNRLPIRDRLLLFIGVCRGIQHAHQKGVIHRDLKPSNVLVSVIDGRPVPKVIDFGIAKAIEGGESSDADVTERGQLVGSLAYMSPEQAQSSSHGVDTRSDVYCLGMLLYELLTGVLPFDIGELRKQGYVPMLRAICEVEPKSPSARLASLGEASSQQAEQRSTAARKLVASLRGDLDAIVLKCLDKDPAARYDTANELVVDLQRYLKFEPVSAGAQGIGRRVAKFVRRNHVGVAVGAVVLSTMLLGIIGTTVGMMRAQQALQIAEQEKERALYAEAKAKESQEVSAKVSNAVRQIFHQFPKDNSGRVHTPFLKRCLDNASKRLDLKQVGNDLVRAELNEVVALAYLLIGAYDAAESHLNASLPAEAEYDPLNAEHRQRKFLLAGVYARKGKLEEALRIRRENLEICKRLYPENHLAIIRAMAGLAHMRSLAKDHRGSAEFYRLAYETTDESATHMRSDFLFLQGTELAACGEKRLALSCWQDSLKLQREVYGNTDFSTLASMQRLASAYLEIDQVDKAIALAEEMCAIEKDLQSTISWERHRVLSDAYFRNGELEKSVEAMEYAVRVSVEKYLPVNKRVLETRRAALSDFRAREATRAEGAAIESLATKSTND